MRISFLKIKLPTSSKQVPQSGLQDSSEPPPGTTQSFRLVTPLDSFDSSSSVTCMLDWSGAGVSHLHSHTHTHLSCPDLIVSILPSANLSMGLVFLGRGGGGRGSYHHMNPRFQCRTLVHFSVLLLVAMRVTLCL